MSAIIQRAAERTEAAFTQNCTELIDKSMKDLKEQFCFSCGWYLNKILKNENIKETRAGLHRTHFAWPRLWRVVSPEKDKSVPMLDRSETIRSTALARTSHPFLPREAANRDRHGVMWHRTRSIDDGRHHTVQLTGST